MKRHYTRTTTGVRCVTCRQEFDDTRTLGKHYSITGKCKNPLLLGLVIDMDRGPYHWKKAA